MYFLKGKEHELMLQEKTDRLHHLSIVNEELERSMVEKEQNSLSLTIIVKDLEQQVEINIREKEENEKVYLFNNFEFEFNTQRVERISGLISEPLTWN